MNDNELIAWQVVDKWDDVHFTCLNKSTAEYLRDWMNAESFNESIDHCLSCITTFTDWVNDYKIIECEVIVG